MEFSGDGIVVEKPTNELDDLVLSVVAELDALDVRYVVVSGYVAVLFGRSRATEDIDVIVERFDEGTADELADNLQDAGFWGPAMPLEQLYETLADGLPVRVARAGDRVPNVELKFATDEADRASLRNTTPVVFDDATLRIGSLELQIAYKLDMGTEKDIEDAYHLYEVTEGNLNTRQLEEYVERLGVEDEYERLRSRG